MNIGKESAEAIQVEPLLGPPQPKPVTRPVMAPLVAPLAVETRTLVTA